MFAFQQGNFRSGIDTPPPDFCLIAKINFPSEDRERVIVALRDLEKIRREALDPARTHGVQGAGKPVIGYWATNLLVAFGQRFFQGPLSQRQPDPGIPNFPPEGNIPPRKPTRFGLKCPVPKHLRTMSAFGDIEWARIRMQRAGQVLSPEAVQAEYAAWLEDGEADLFLLMESNNRYLVHDLWDRIDRGFVRIHELALKALHDGFNRGDGRDHLGWQDGVSSLSDMMTSDPDGYRSKIYLPRQAPSYPGEAVTNRDPLEFDGGTYLVHRKYIEHRAAWRDRNVRIVSHDGTVFQGDEARDRIIGRMEQSGSVIERNSGCPLQRERDSAEVHLGPYESHILQARGGKPAPFKAPFPPLEGDDVHLFRTQDIRIRRRGFSFWELDGRSGESLVGLHFMCFQNNIQQLGFEFINNIWLMNPNFHLNSDQLLLPANGFVEPIEGCYYFVPPPHREFAGDVLFR